MINSVFDASIGWKQPALGFPSRDCGSNTWFRLCRCLIKSRLWLELDCGGGCVDALDAFLSAVAYAASLSCDRVAKMGRCNFFCGWLIWKKSSMREVCSELLSTMTGIKCARIDSAVNDIFNDMSYTNTRL